jgi:hypothetical protein
VHEDVWFKLYYTESECSFAFAEATDSGLHSDHYPFEYTLEKVTNGKGLPKLEFGSPEQLQF